MICWYCNQKFGAKDGIKCNMDGHLLDRDLFSKKWQEPNCPALLEYNKSILEALKGANDGT